MERSVIKGEACDDLTLLLECLPSLASVEASVRGHRSKTDKNKYSQNKSGVKSFKGESKNSENWLSPEYSVLVRVLNKMLLVQECIYVNILIKFCGEERRKPAL